MQNILHAVASAFFTGLLAIGSLFSPAVAPVGATIPVSVAVFQTSLASAVTSSATSMTLVNGTNAAGNTLSGYTCFNLDEGTSLEEFVCGTASGTAVTSMLRGIDPKDGDLEVTALKKAHRRGASVKITDYPSIAIVSRILNGDETLPNKISYNAHPTFSADTEIIDKKYADDLAFVGAPDATTSAKGVSEEATESEINAGTAAGGTAARLFINPSTLATSNYFNFLPLTAQKDALVGTSGTPSTSNKYVTNDDTATTSTASEVVRADSSGKIDATWLNGSSLIKKGGDGSDGALTCSSGTTNLDIGSAAVFVKNYTSISITGTCAITFTNPSSSGTAIIWRSQGAVTITSSANPVIDLRSLGSSAGTAGAGGASGVDGSAGSDGTINTFRYSHLASVTPVAATKGGLGTGNSPSALAGVATLKPTTYMPLTADQLERWYINESYAFSSSSGGAGAGGGRGGSVGSSVGGGGGAGGRGAGTLIIEAAGTYTFTTGTINAAGANGAAATATVNSGGGGGGGGGGAGGIVMVFAPSITTSGTVTVTGGNGGNGSAAINAGTGNNGGAGGGGGGGNALYSGGNGGVGGTDGSIGASNPGSAGGGTGAGTGGNAGGGGAGTHGSGNTFGSGGGGGGGAAGIYLTVTL